MNGYAQLYCTDGRIIGSQNNQNRICDANGTTLFTVSQHILTSLRTGIRYSILADGRVVDPKGVQVAYYQAPSGKTAAPQQAKTAAQPAQRPADKPTTMGFVLYTILSVIVIVYLLPPLTAQMIGLCASIGIWQLHKYNMKTAAWQYDADHVDWAGIANNIQDIRNLVSGICYLPIMAEGDHTLAEVLDNAYTWYKSDTSWVLSSTMIVDDRGFARKHGKDPTVKYSGSYVSITYPYPAHLKDRLEQLDHNCGITLYDNGFGGLDFRLGIPADIPPAVIRDRLNSANRQLNDITAMIPRRSRDVLTTR